MGACELVDCPHRGALDEWARGYTSQELVELSRRRHSLFLSHASALDGFPFFKVILHQTHLYIFLSELLPPAVWAVSRSQSCRFENPSVNS